MRTRYQHPASTTGSARGTTGRRTFLAAALASAGAGAVGLAQAAVAPTAAAAAPAPATSAAPPGLTVVVSSSAYPTVHDALRSVPTSGTLLVDRSERVARPLVVDRPTTVLFAPA